jgi:hypothetical protein
VSKTQATGGLAVVRPAPIIHAPRGTFGISLLSDLHIGASNVDYGAIKADLEAARDNGDRILLGGDIFDLILPSDRKRYKPGVLHPRLEGRADIVNEAVAWAAEMLGPYADLIDGIGVGNHETAAEQHHSVDAVRWLIESLDTVDPERDRIPQLGYTGFIDYQILPARGKRPVSRYVVWYSHGSGRASTAALALKKVIGAAQSFAADLYWSGHHHVRAHATEIMIHADRNRPSPVTRDVKAVVTGSYMVPYGYQSQQSMRKRGRKSNYAAEAGVRPGAIGGARVVLRFGQKPDFPARVEVIQ